MIRASDLGAVDLGKLILVKVVEIDALTERKTRSAATHALLERSP
jgi:hypothetical protein